MKYIVQISLFLVLVLTSSYDYYKPYDSSRLIDYVDPFIGTGFHGHTFPGAVVPFGGVQLSPDTRINGWDACSGYHYSDSKMYGFSHTHLSGTGIGDLGDILFLPFTGKKPLDSVASFSHKREKASPGYYSVVLDDYAIKCELSATKHTAWHKYTFPKNKQTGLLIDLGHLLRKDWPSKVLEGSIKVINNRTIEGYHLSNGWAAHDPIWFRAEFDAPFEVTKLTTELGEHQQKNSATGTDIKMLLTFGKMNKPLTIKVSISGVDEIGARKNMDEVKGINSFEQIVYNAEKQWEETLSSIQIKSNDKDVLTNFYTAMYHSHIAPTLFSDVDGRYMGMDKKIHKSLGDFYTTFSLWDTYRAWFPLMTIVQPEKSKQWVYNLYQASEEDLLLPKWPLRGNYTATMVGYPSMAILADAMTKGLADSIPQKLVDAGVRSATWQPEWREKHSKTRAKGVTNIFMAQKEEFGYVPADKQEKTVSWGLEMAYYDWCLGIMAKEASNEKLAKEWLSKGQYYRNYFDPSTGYMRAKMKDGSWIQNFEPSFSSHKGGQYIEGNSYQWSPFVPHDIEGLKGLIGGDKKFVTWLDKLFAADSKLLGEDVSMDITGLIGQYAHGNEPGHHIPYLYNYANRPDRTAEIVDEILYKFYKPTPDGIIGNEDCGQMSAWYIMSAMGFYQVCPGKPVYDLGRPIIDQAKIKVKNGFFTIKIYNNSKQNRYIQKAFLNGKKIDNNQFSHSSIISGGRLEIYMDSTPN